MHDGHTVVHKMPEPVPTNKIFEGMCSNFQAKILKITSHEFNSCNCSQIHIVFDKYNIQVPVIKEATQVVHHSCIILHNMLQCPQNGLVLRLRTKEMCCYTDYQKKQITKISNNYQNLKHYLFKITLPLTTANTYKSHKSTSQLITPLHKDH